MARYRRSQNGRQRESGTGIDGSSASASAGTGESIGTETGDARSSTVIGTEEIEHGDGIEAGDGIYIDPRSAEGAIDGSEEGTPRKRRGRPKGSRNGKTKTVSTSLEGIEGILLSLHMMGAAMTGIPELALTEKESSQLSDAIARVASYYDLAASEKTLAWINLAVIAGGIYGTRAFAYHLRIKADADSKKQKSNVVSFG